MTTATTSIGVCMFGCFTCPWKTLHQLDELLWVALRSSTIEWVRDPCELGKEYLKETVKVDVDSTLGYKL